MTAKLGAKQVDKLAKSALNAYINDMVYDILNNALDKPTGMVEEEEEVVEIVEKDMHLQLSSQVSKFHPNICCRSYLRNPESQNHVKLCP